MISRSSRDGHSRTRPGAPFCQPDDDLGWFFLLTLLKSQLDIELPAPPTRTAVTRVSTLAFVTGVLWLAPVSGQLAAIGACPPIPEPFGRWPLKRASVKSRWRASPA